MGKINYRFLKTVMENVAFQMEDIQGEINVESSFEIEVVLEDPAKFQIRGAVSLSQGEVDDAFLAIVCTGYFDSNNTKEKLEISDFESSEDLINYVMPEISETVAFITKKAFGAPIEIPAMISDENFADTDSQED